MSNKVNCKISLVDLPDDEHYAAVRALYERITVLFDNALVRAGYADADYLSRVVEDVRSQLIQAKKDLQDACWAKKRVSSLLGKCLVSEDQLNTVDRILSIKAGQVQGRIDATRKEIALLDSVQSELQRYAWVSVGLKVYRHVAMSSRVKPFTHG